MNPNIVLVMSDDQGWGDAGYNGNPVLKTPCLDVMAEQAVRLDRFYAAAPVCSPTRGSCLTGRHPYRYGVFWADVGHLPRQESTIAGELAGLGYATGHFGKWHLGTLSTTESDATRGGADQAEHYSPPWDHGFAECFSTESRMPTYNPMVWGGGTWTPGVEGLSTFKQIMDRPVEYGEMPGTHDVDPWHAAYWTGPGERVDDPLHGDDSKIIMDRALSFIDAKAGAETPFFAVIWFHTPHTPIAAGHEHRRPYLEHPIEAQHYYGCITAMDEQIGRLREGLRELDIAPDTLVWFCSDNGPSYIHDFNSAGPFRGKKATLFEGGLRVPGIVEWPGSLVGGRSISTPLVTSDFYPTLLNLVGAETGRTDAVDGIDAMPILTGDLDERPSPIAFQSPMRGSNSDSTSEKQFALSDNRYKILSSDNGESFELYDLIDDPGESKDIARSHSQIVTEMRSRLETWVVSCERSLAGADYS